MVMELTSKKEHSTIKYTIKRVMKRRENERATNTMHKKSVDKHTRNPRPSSGPAEWVIDIVLKPTKQPMSP